MRWSVYKIVRKPLGVREAIPLGYVNAPHQPDALAAAWRKWPDETDPSMVQNGFSVRPYADDPMSLGRQAKKREN